MESDPGRGTAVHLTVPVQISRPDHARAALPNDDAVGRAINERDLLDGEDGGAEPALDPYLSRTLPLRILLADDNAVNQKLGLRILERLGYRADTAANGHEVLAALARQPYDVVLLDVQMPEMDGLTAAREICAAWAPPARPQLIAMSAGLHPNDREACQAAGMVGTIHKPIQAAAVQAALCRWGVRRADPARIPPAGHATPKHGEQDGDHPAHLGAAEGGDRPPFSLVEQRAGGLGSAIDHTVIAMLRRELQEPGETDVVAELVGLFQAGAPPLIARIHAALAAGDVRMLRQAAHTLRSSSDNLGAKPLAALCADLEHHARAGNLAGLALLQARLDAEYARTVAALTTEPAAD